MGIEDQAKVMKYIQNLSKLCRLYNTTFWEKVGPKPTFKKGWAKTKHTTTLGQN
jgi:hypothetical protein